MEWSKKSEHVYNKFIPLKKEALSKYCKIKNFKSLWLDFSYDNKFRKIYKQVLKNYRGVEQ